MIVVLMGVAGCGKTTVGKLLAQTRGWKFYDGDEFHPPANVAKMSAGEPLDDADRAPWLERLNQLLSVCARDGESAVLACSALKRSYRERLAQGIADMRLVYLRGDFATIHARLAAREHHFMKPGLLESQFTALQEPQHALVVDITDAPQAIVERICRGLDETRP
jgi:gluconokinase